MSGHMHHIFFFAPVKHVNQGNHSTASSFFFTFMDYLHTKHFHIFYLSDKTSELNSSLNLTLKFRETAIPAVEISLVFPQVWKFRFKPCSFKTMCECKDLKSDFLKLWEKQPSSSNNSVSVRDFPLVKMFSLCANAFWVTGCVCRSASLIECVSLRCCFSCAERAATLKPQAFGCSTSGRKVAWHSPGLNQFHPDLSENGEERLKKTQKTSLATGVSQSESRTTVSGSNLFFSPSLPHHSASERKKSSLTSKWSFFSVYSMSRSDMFLWPNVSAALYAEKVLQVD